FVPSSWFSPLPAEISASVVNGVQAVVLPIARQRLQGRVEDLLGTSGRAPVIIDDLDPTDPKSLASYLGEVRGLNRNIARYNALASPDSGNAEQLAGLVEYLFGEHLVVDTTSVTSEFQEALRVAAGPQLTITPAQTNAVVARAVGLVAAVADTATRQLTGRASTRPEDDLRALRRLRDLADLTDPKIGLAAMIRDPSPSGSRVAKAVQDSINARLTVAATLVLRDTLLPDQASQRLRSVLSGLFAMRLMEPVEDRTIADELRPGMTLRWDIGQLELAFALRGELRRAQIAATDAFPTATQTRLRSAFDTQMRSRLIDIVAGAQRFTPDALSPVNQMRSVAENIEGASERVTRLASLLDTLRAGADGRKLIVIGTRQAEHVLALAQIVVDSAGYLAPRPIVVQAWRGGVPIGFAALGVNDSGAFRLRLEREQVPPLQTLARDVQPALSFLTLPVVTGAMISSPKLIADWRGIVAGSRTDTVSGLRTLYDYITTTLGPIDQPSCQAAALRPDPARASDWYGSRRAQFRAALLGRCHPGGSGEALASYDRLRSVFTTKLAGKYPFVEATKAAGAPDADPAAVREFYQLYDAYAKAQDIRVRSDPRVGPGARSAFVFLDLVKQARPFFAAFIDSGTTRKAPEFGFVVEALATGEMAELHTGSRVSLLNDSTHSGVWSFGEDLKIIPDGETKPSFMSTRAWSLAELAAMQQTVRVRFYHPDTKVRIALPSFPTVAPAIPVPGR
ncbi:MAG: hypothetical protein ABIR92_09040, partial [Gemmatimonadaceae bacterium]